MNDAPTLAQAHVGVAMGTGTEVAMESAGVTLVRDDLRGILRSQRLSHRTIRSGCGGSRSSRRRSQGGRDHG